MQERIYFYLLILCGIGFQGIIGTFPDGIILAEKSSDFLVRQKRVVSYLPGEDISLGIVAAPFVVTIKRVNRVTCVGSILSHHIVITTKRCALFEPSQYVVFSGAARTDHGRIHNVTDIIKHSVNLPFRPADGIALLIVDLPFIYKTFTKNIELHSGPLLSGTQGTIIGWGYNCGSNNYGTKTPRSLRKIVVPIMAHRDCVNIYRPYQLEITDKDICTFHSQKHCGHTDEGAPLVVDGYLAGVHLWTGPTGKPNDPRYPEVFAILQNSAYERWITNNVRNIEANFLNSGN